MDKRTFVVIVLVSKSRQMGQVSSVASVLVFIRISVSSVIGTWGTRSCNSSRLKPWF